MAQEKSDQPLKEPKILYNKDGKVEVCDTVGQIAIANAKGFNWPKPPSKVVFPKAIYAKDGSTALATDEADLKKKLKDGFTEDFVAPAAVQPQAAASAGASQEMTRFIMDEISDLRERVQVLESLATQPVK